jgi:hypothetical protein
MYAHNQKIGKPNNLKVIGASKPKGLNRIAKIDYGQIFLRDDNLYFYIQIVNNWELYIKLPEQPEPLNRNESGRLGALKSDSTHHFFRNACTKSGLLQFLQFY